MSISFDSLQTLFAKDVIPDRQPLDFFGPPSSVQGEIGVEPNAELPAEWLETLVDQGVKNTHKRKSTNFETEANVPKKVSDKRAKLQKASKAQEQSNREEITRLALACFKEVLGPNCKDNKEVDALCIGHRIDRNIVESCAKLCAYLLKKIASKAKLSDKRVKDHINRKYAQLHPPVVKEWLRLLAKGDKTDQELVAKIKRVGAKIGIIAIFKASKSEPVDDASDDQTAKVKKKDIKKNKTNESDLQVLHCLEEILGPNCNDDATVTAVCEAHGVKREVAEIYAKAGHYIFKQLEKGKSLEEILHHNSLFKANRKYAIIANIRAVGKWVESQVDENVIEKIKKVGGKNGIVSIFKKK